MVFAYFFNITVIIFQNIFQIEINDYICTNNT